MEIDHRLAPLGVGSTGARRLQPRKLPPENATSGEKNPLETRHGVSGSQTAYAIRGRASSADMATSSAYCPPLKGGTGLLRDGDFSQAQEPGGNGDSLFEKGAVFAPVGKCRRAISIF